MIQPYSVLKNKPYQAQVKRFPELQMDFPQHFSKVYNLTLMANHHSILNDLTKYLRNMYDMYLSIK